MPWYRSFAIFDGANRPVMEAVEPTEQGVQGSIVETTYTQRGTVRQVKSDDKPLIRAIHRDANGLVTDMQYGDGASTTTAITYDSLQRVQTLGTFRARPPLWSSTPTNDEKNSQQLILQDEQYEYDRVGNPLYIHDWRNAAEWPDIAQPVSRSMKYDDLYRLTQVNYQYPTSIHPWKDPYAAEAADSSRPQPSPRADMTADGRVLSQSYTYDWLGNMSATDDNAHAFYDRSLGTSSFGSEYEGPYQLRHAENTNLTGNHTGKLDAEYDPSGNMTSLTVQRSGACIPAGKCNYQHFQYLWDEVGRLMRARRWDTTNWSTVPPDPPKAELEYAYDASDMRVRKSAGTSHTLYIFGGLELKSAQFTAPNQYEISDRTEVDYLMSHGERIARVVRKAPDSTGSTSAVYLELGDVLGSTSVVMDWATGELVERSTAYAYGAVESDYRPARWNEFREDYRFTGKEDDIEVGLIYFGARYYAPLLGQWISADPLAVHVPGEADWNVYAYVHGRVFVATDPLGMLSDYNQGGEINGEPADIGLNISGDDPIDMSGWGVEQHSQMMALYPPLAPVYQLEQPSAKLSQGFEEPPELMAAYWASPNEIFASNLDMAARGGPLATAGVIGGRLRGENEYELNAGAQFGAVVWDMVTGVPAMPSSVGRQQERLELSLPTGSVSPNGFADSPAELVENARRERASEVGKHRNWAAVQYSIDGVEGEALAHSGKEAAKGTVGMPPSPVFQSFDVTHQRDRDSEKKLMEFFPPYLSENSTGVIWLHTERPPCASCASVIDQFRLSYPFVGVKVTWGND